jgi:hypothetical protein
MTTQKLLKFLTGALFLGAAAMPFYAMAQYGGTPRAPAKAEAATPDLSGLWARQAVRGEVTYLEVPGDKEGKPIERVWIDGPDVEEIVAANYANPILQPWAREIVKKNTESEIKLVHINEADDICRPVGIPQIINLREPVVFAQTKDQVLIIYQRDHLVRRVYMNQKHSANPKLSWFGESVGHYEGDTFVVDTIALKPGKVSVLDNYGTPHTDKLHVTERYRVINDDKGKGLEVIFRVEDPGTFTMPWKGMAVYRPNRAPMIDEVACAENDRSFGEGSAFGDVPRADKPDF